MSAQRLGPSTPGCSPRSCDARTESAGLYELCSGARQVHGADALAAIYQLIGAIYFFAISEPTLTRMFGKREYRRLEETYPARLRALIRACFSSPPAAQPAFWSGTGDGQRT
jgi:hypothetical protein